MEARSVLLSLRVLDPDPARSHDRVILPSKANDSLAQYRTTQDYIYALITGYVDAPAGVEVREGLNYSAFP